MASHSQADSFREERNISINLSPKKWAQLFFLSPTPLPTQPPLLEEWEGNTKCHSLRSWVLHDFTWLLTGSRPVFHADWVSMSPSFGLKDESILCLEELGRFSVHSITLHMHGHTKMNDWSETSRDVMLWKFKEWRNLKLIPGLGIFKFERDLISYRF